MVRLRWAHPINGLDQVHQIFLHCSHESDVTPSNNCYHYCSSTNRHSTRHSLLWRQHFNENKTKWFVLAVYHQLTLPCSWGSQNNPAWHVNCSQGLGSPTQQLGACFFRQCCILRYTLVFCRENDLSVHFYFGKHIYLRKTVWFRKEERGHSHGGHLGPVTPSFVVPRNFLYSSFQIFIQNEHLAPLKF